MCRILAQDLSSQNIFVLMAGAQPLRSADWEELKTAARAWVVQCRGEVRVPTLAERLEQGAARAFWAIGQRASHREDLSLGAQPCELCGEITHSWCETCVIRPWGPVCTVCDGDHRVCGICKDQGKVWEAARGASAEVVEVFGYHNAEGIFVELEEPMRIPRVQFDVVTESGVDPSDIIAQLIGQLYTPDGRRLERNSSGAGA